MDGEPGDGGGGERGRLRLGAVGVEHKVGEEEEESLGGSGLQAARGPQHQPARVNSSG